MAYIDLMVLVSRYIFVGFAAIFVVIALSFMDPFVPFRLGDRKSKAGVLYFCTVFFHIGASAIILVTNPHNIPTSEILQNSITVFIAITATVAVLRLLKRQDELVVWQIVLFLLDVSYIMLQRLDHSLATQQINWMLISLFVAVIMVQGFRGLINPKYKKVYLVLTLINIMLPFFFGQTINGATNWVKIGPITFQPSEFGKVAYVLYLASLCENYKKDSKNKSKYVRESIIVMGVILGCLMLQTDLGGGLLYYLMFLVNLFIMRGEFGLPLLGGAAIGLGGIVGYQMFSHVRVRVAAWIDPWADITGTGYQVVQGLFAMGTWGWFGSGLTRGTPYKIPYVTTDYIFAAIGEELGNLFIIAIVLCYLAIVLYGLKIALMQKDKFHQALAIGIVNTLAFQAFIIMGGILKIIPLTGVTLPFISYGGSSLFVSVLLIGILGVLRLNTSTKKAKDEGAGGE